MQSLSEYLVVNSGLRDEQWEQDFLKVFVFTKVYVVEESVQIGPDGWPYLYLTDDKNKAHKSEDTVNNLIQWAYENGVGLVLNADKERPDYVFHYGMIWNFVHNKYFVKDEIVNTPPNAPIYIAQVSEDLVPKHALNFIKDYIKSAGIDDPRCALISRDKLNYDFAVSIESIGNPPKKEHEGIARGIGWFLPNHLPVALVYEDKLQRLFEI